MALPEFTEQDTHRFNKDARRIIALARVLQWSVRWANVSRRMVTLISPDGGKKINVPTSSINAHRLTAMARQIITHSRDDFIRSLMTSRADMMKEPDMAEMIGWIAQFMDVNPSELPTPATEPERKAVPIENVPLPLEVEKPKPKPPKNDTPLVTSTEPYLIWYVNGHRLKEPAPSTRVVTRHWSDGHIDYLCAKVGCGYSALDAGPVTSHHTFKHERDKFKAPSGVKPKLEVFPGDPTAGARDAVSIVEQIAAIIGGIPASRVDELTARVSELEDALLEATVRADRAEGDLKALRDLLGRY